MLDDLKSLNGWPDKVKLMQKNWIGKSYGCEIDFKIHGQEEKIKVFTTRPDTIFGASFIALSADHALSKKFTNDKNFIKFAKKETENYKSFPKFKFFNFKCCCIIDFHHWFKRK